MNFIFELFSVPTAYASIDNFLASVNKHIFNPLIYFLFAVAFVVFLFGVVKFLANQDNESERSTGKKHMIFGLIGLTIMFTVWALINIIVGTLNISDDVTPDSSSIEGSVHLQDINVNFNALGID